MLRLAEILLFLAPFAAFALWRLAAPVSGPSPRLIILTAGVLLVLAAILFWFSREDVLPPGSVYAPAQMQDGQLVPGRGVKR